MKKRKIIILLTTLILFMFVSFGAIFAEYYFSRTLQDGKVDLGKIELIGDAKYLSYAKKDEDGKFTTERLETPEEISLSDGVVQCYASKKTGYSGESEFMSLNQLAFEFEFSATIDVYVRVQVYDSWISRKYYSGSQNATDTVIPKDNRKNYIEASNVSASNVMNYYTVVATKALNYNQNETYYELSNNSYIEATTVVESTFGNGTYYTLNVAKATAYNPDTRYYYDTSSPFSVSNDGWVYDEKTGYIYCKTKYSGSSDVTKVSFELNDSYYYPVEVVTGYREEILVNVAFNVDIVQANRAYKKWGIDMNTYFN